MKPLYIFDLDGTLALVEHRLHYIQGHKKDWPAFFAACIDDPPVQSAITTLHCLRRGGGEIWVWTGRSDEVRSETLSWLVRHSIFHPYWNPFEAPEQLLMCQAGDHRSDVSIKREWLARLDPPELVRLTAVFEDRASVVQMWRDMGVPCFQAASGEF